MRAAFFFISFAITFLLIFFLNRTLSIGDTSIPPIGKLMNPYSGFWQNAEATDYLPNETYDFAPLKGKVTVQYDDRMVPHIFAENNEDAIFVQGFITAQNRLFQMDLSARATQGRLSEILGENVVKRDINQRRKGMVFAAENAVKAWQEDEEGWELLNLYSQGINSYIASLDPGDIPIEYKLIGTEPEKWSPLKTALFVKAMAASLAGVHYDVEATNSMKKFGKDTFDFLYPRYMERQSPIIPKEKKWTFTPKPIPNDKTENDVIDYFDYKIYDRPPAGIGSNNWAVSGTRTKSGNPILGGDPHLGLTLPSIWYEMQIKTPDMNAYGVSLPGIPFIVIGFNDHIAWSQTNVGHDITDLYQIKWKDEKKDEYLYDGEYKKVEYKVESYIVKDKGITISDTVRYTIWGPVLYESDERTDKDLAFSWLAHHASDKNELRTFYDLNQAQNFDEFYNAINPYNVPAQNFAFASKDGDIALRIMGQFPLREKNQGRFVRDGSLSSSAWKGFIPKAHIPIIKNPERGYVSSANQHSVTPDYPYETLREIYEEYRGRSANRYLAKNDKMTIEDMMAMHNSNYDIKAEEALPLLLLNLDSAQIRNNKFLIDLLENWDFVYDADTQAGTFFARWWQQVYWGIWDEMKPDNYSYLPPSSGRTITLLKETPESSFFDNQSTSEKETIKNIITVAFMKAKEELGEDIPIWTKHQGSYVAHLAQIPAFARTNIGVGGVHSALNAMTDVHGPSWRQIVELGDEVKAYVSYPGGQSGNPGSKHYDDFLNKWAEGKYYEALFMKDENDHSRMMTSKQIFK